MERDIVLPFGKYKGIPIIHFNTPQRTNYLYWLRNTPTAWGKLNQSVKNAINVHLT